MSDIAEAKNEVADIKLLHDIVIVKPVKEKEYSGLVIPEHLQEAGQTGIVYNVSPGIMGDDGVCEEPMQVKVGDKIFYCKYAGSEIRVEMGDFIIMKQEDILAKFNGDRKIDLVPLEDRVFIEWERGQDEYKGTKILRAEGSAKERYFTGIVISVGPKVNELKAGDRIFFDQFCGPERIDFESKRYAMIWEKDVYCILPERKNVMVLSH